jgi:lysophospholipase L1-like esterase
MTRILIFGDSVAEGYYDLKNGGCVNLLKIYYFKKNQNIQITNCSISGDCSNNILNRFTPYFNSYCKKGKGYTKKAIIIFSFGSNDSYKKSNKKNVNEKEFEINILKLLKLCKNEKQIEKVYFFLSINVDENLTNPTIWDKILVWENKRIIEYGKIISKICKKNKIETLDLFNLLNKKDFFDGVHPNSKGHKKIFSKVKKFFKENIG